MGARCIAEVKVSALVKHVGFSLDETKLKDSNSMGILHILDLGVRKTLQVDLVGFVQCVLDAESLRLAKPAEEVPVSLGEVLSPSVDERARNGDKGEEAHQKDELLNNLEVGHHAKA